MNAQMICRNVSLGYEGNIVVKGLDFTINKGDYLCILGENGSGKSTLIKAILGLKPPIKGKIDWCGDTKKNEIGYLSQQTVVQKDFPASVCEIVRSGCLAKCRFRPFYNKKDKKLAESVMQQLDIIKLAKRCYRELSGGQQQRVLLARALCATRKILLLDEPVTGLDPKAQTELYELIAKLNRENITIIMVSHDIQSSIKYASHILHIGSKKQLFFGKKEDYTKNKIRGTFFPSEVTENE